MLSDLLTLLKPSVPFRETFWSIHVRCHCFCCDVVKIISAHSSSAHTECCMVCNDIHEYWVVPKPFIICFLFSCMFCSSFAVRCNESPSACLLVLLKWATNSQYYGLLKVVLKECNTYFGTAGYRLYVHSHWLAVVKLHTAGTTSSCSEQGVLPRILVYPKTFCTLKGVYKLPMHTQARVVSSCDLFQCMCVRHLHS